MTIAATDNARLKQGYARYIGHSFLIVVGIHLFLFYFAPPFEFKPYRLINDEPIVWVPTDDYAIPAAPREVPRPPVAIEPAGAGEEVTDVEIPENAFGDFSAGFAPRAPEGERVTEFIAFNEPPVLISSVRPAYPELSRQSGIEGQVLLRVLVDTDGTVRDVSVLQSDVTPAMDKAAIAAAWHFRFRPAKQGAVSVRAHIVVPVIFKLH